MKKLVFICILGLFFNSVNAQIDSAIFNKLSYAAQQEILVQQQIPQFQDTLRYQKVALIMTIAWQLENMRLHL